MRIKEIILNRDYYHDQVAILKETHPKPRPHSLVHEVRVYRNNFKHYHHQALRLGWKPEQKDWK